MGLGIRCRSIMGCVPNLDVFCSTWGDGGAVAWCEKLSSSSSGMSGRGVGICKHLGGRPLLLGPERLGERLGEEGRLRAGELGGEREREREGVEGLEGLERLLSVWSLTRKSFVVRSGM